MMRAHARAVAGWLARIVRIRSDEQRDVGAAFLTLLGSMCGHSLLETARDSLFLGNLSAQRLPWVYLAIAALALALGGRTPAAVTRLSPRNELSAWLLFAGAVSLAFFGLLGTGWAWVYFALYVWSGLLATLVLVRFWIVVGNLFTVTQAKRVYAVIGTGSVLGAIVGSATAVALAELVSARWLVLAASVAFALSSLAPLALAKPRGVARPTPTRPAEVVRAAKTAWEHPYLRHVGGLVILATITFTLVDFVFKSAVAMTVPPEQLDNFFSSVYLGLNILSLGVQAFLVPRLLQRARVSAVIALIPALILSSSIGFGLVGGIVWALLLKGSDGGLRHSLYRTTTELLFLPVAGATRARLKTAIDVVGQRGGQALGSVVILVGLGLSDQPALFAWIAAATAALWLYVAVGMRNHYLTVVRESVTRGVSIEDAHLPELDVTALDVLLAALNDPSERRVIAALDVIEFQGNTSVIPALVLYHPSPGVIERALSAFETPDRDDVSAILPQLVKHPDRTVRAGALRLLSLAGPSSAPLEADVSGDDEMLRLVADLACATREDRDVPSTRAALHKAMEAGEPRLISQVLRLIAALRNEGFEPIVRELIHSTDGVVAREAIRAAQRTGMLVAIPDLIAQLDRPSVRDSARAALVSLGDPAAQALTDTLGNDQADPAIRGRVPRALAAFRTQQAGDVLQARLDAEPDDLIRYRIIRGLGRWRADRPYLKVDRALANRWIVHYIERGLRLIRWRTEIVLATPANQTSRLHQVLMHLLAAQARHALACSFRLLNLRDREDDYRRIFVGLESPSERFRARSRELLDLLVPGEHREKLLELADALSDSGVAESRVSVRDSTGILREIAGMESDALRSVALERLDEVMEAVPQ